MVGTQKNLKTSTSVVKTDNFTSKYDGLSRYSWTPTLCQLHYYVYQYHTWPRQRMTKNNYLVKYTIKHITNIYVHFCTDFFLVSEILKLFLDQKKITVTVLNKCINPWLFPRPVHMRARENVMPPPSVNINFVISELQKSKNCKGITAIEINMERGKRDSKLS